ncbi:MAG: three-Cys-motif partner protein TcmP [Dehalococcoidia bacterium]|nr:three-Cys-motif partner protein TcmP [Dehalococcoidia bacterium]MYK25998.1 three-Cys-motif partner protein TcmP [Dehalococcoidia bacterium]
MTDVLDGLGRFPLAPAFVMVDPFGVKGLPLQLLRRLAAFPKTELLVSFMYESISRWLAQPNYEVALDNLFGVPQWRDAEGLEGDEKKAFLSQLYATQLKGIGMDYVRLFEMGDGGNRTEYFLAFGTHSHHGLRVMKDAMWTVDPAGGVRFSDFTAPDPAQATLFDVEPDLIQLQGLLIDRFSGKARIPIKEIDRFVLVETAFRETHGKEVLRRLQRAEKIDADRPANRSKSFWGEGTLVTFPSAD